MRATQAAVTALFLLGLPAVAQQPGPPPTQLEQRLRAAQGVPVQDPDAGRLYEKAARLLERAREMPSEIEIPRPAAPPPETSAEKPEPGSPETTAEPSPAEEEKPAWRRVLEKSVVEAEKLAYTHYQAGQYGRAAELYAGLREQQPDNLHLLAMLFLCERNAGKADRAAALLQELRSDAQRSEWARWVEGMMQLSAPRNAERDNE